MPRNLDAKNSRAFPAPRPFPPPQPTGRGGFTLIELLVVIGVIGILAAILLPVLASVKERAVRIKCLANVKQYDLGLISYGHDNSDRLPRINFGDWACQLDMSIADMMLNQYGVTRDVLYCPAYSEFNNDPYWNDTLSSSWGPHRTVGYCTSLSGTHNVIPSNWVTSLAPQMLQITLPRKKPSDPRFGIVWTQPSATILVADMTPSNLSATGDDPTQPGSYLFDGVQGEDGLGDGTGPAVRLRGNHMNLDRRERNELGIPEGTDLPRGGNNGFLDGHARWTRFTDMLPRTTNSETIAGAYDPVFWW